METTLSEIDQTRVESENEIQSQNPTIAYYQLTIDKGRRNRSSYTRISNDEFVILYSTLESVNSELTTFEEVVYQKESKLFKEAMKEEMDSLIKNKTMILSNRPKDLKIIDCKCVHKVKEVESNVESKSYVAKLVAKGSHKENVLIKIYSLQLKNIRFLLALTTHFNWELNQLDVKTTFLNGDVDEIIYMNQPKNCIVNCKSKNVYLLKKSIC